MKNSSFFLVLVIIFLGCNITEEGESVPNDLEIELQELLKKPTSSPEGELFKVLTYGGDSDMIFSTRERIYPVVGDIIVDIIKEQNEDTTGIGVNYFENGKIQFSHFFDFLNHQAIWQSTREYMYDSKGLLKELFIETASQPHRLLANYRYDSLDRLVMIEYPIENGAELQVYTYDESNRITSEWKSVVGQEDYKIDFLVYEYSSSNLLTAKKSGERGNLEGNFKDAFRYFYDQSKKLSSEEEFDPYFGFQQVRRTEYYYY
ncbi:hypothetical protein PBT90_20005 [Algoriphagus halophytocola]|uniref:hypothetical protein n=1 Tax=Algoriphagus halophytocola TaxID=2991499 RepID=UPI0022DCF9F6|nr:hypothetical protein [Algoriphagus sp. TR-M9]WBL43014.1 hypothetical protein PBT90_20005 [Algoriphagus sp. TR-M9]